MESPVAIPCSFADCDLLAVPGEGALVLLAGPLVFLVCERCRERLRCGRLMGIVGRALDRGGIVHEMHVMIRPEASA